MFNGKNKAVTFSYDDGVTQDIRLIEIFNKYNLKATFNLNSELLGTENSLVRNGVNVLHNKVKPEDVRSIYDGHEVAVHTLTHPNLTQLEDEEIIREVECDRQNLSELVGYDVMGMAYPCGGINCNDHVANIIRDNTPIKYARTVPVSYNFDVPMDLLQYKGTLYHHEDWDIMFDTARKFLNLKTDTPQIFYIWGHTYEFDIYPERWRLFESFCEEISNNPDVFYGTNLEVFSLL